MMESYDTHIKRVIGIKNGWALVQFDDRRCRYLNMNRVDPILIAQYLESLKAMVDSGDPMDMHSMSGGGEK